MKSKPWKPPQTLRHLQDRRCDWKPIILPVKEANGKNPPLTHFPTHRWTWKDKQVWRRVETLSRWGSWKGYSLSNNSFSHAALLACGASWSEAFREEGSVIQVQRCPKTSFTPQMSQKHADVNWVCRGSPCLKWREIQADGRKTERKTITDRNQYWRGESNPVSQLFRRLWRQICSDESREKCESTPR